MEKFSKIEALRYLIKIGPEYTSEWTEAGMYKALCIIVNSEEEYFTIEYLDELLKNASDY